MTITRPFTYSNLVAADVPAIRAALKKVWAHHEGSDLLDVVQPPDVEAAITRLLAGRNGVLCGPVGSGKTYISNGIAGELVWRGKTTLSIKAVDLAGHPLRTKRVDLDKSEYGRPDWETTLGLLDVDVLLIDDYGLTSDTPTDSKVFDAIFDGRWDAHKQTIMSTNLTREQVEERVGGRNWDRFRPLVVPVLGESRRGGFAPVPHDYFETYTLDGAHLLLGADDAKWRAWINALLAAGLYEAIIASDDVFSAPAGVFAQIVRDVLDVTVAELDAVSLRAGQETYGAERVVEIERALLSDAERERADREHEAACTRIRALTNDERDELLEDLPARIHALKARGGETRRRLYVEWPKTVPKDKWPSSVEQYVLVDAALKTLEADKPAAGSQAVRAKSPSPASTTPAKQVT